MRGRFISLEGGEGTGKSTQARRLAETLRARGHRVTLTREPGGTPNAEAIRTLIVEGEPGRWSPLAETLLFHAARTDHLERLIRPAIGRGDWVVSDRFADSTRIYQGAARGLGAALLAELERIVVGADLPDLTLVLDLPVADGLARARARPGGEDRFEGFDAAFHERLRDGFRALAAAHPERCVLVDALGSADAVAAQVLAAVEARLGA